ncbi:translation initiation factor IF-2 subunit alpha [Methanocrinis sp.]|uniref:translation initiation factor IF-2 subunit alpha n=1 Tax=Methanocrinis sp. TaxID=3101522 RepID=UPI003D0C1A49
MQREGWPEPGELVVCTVDQVVDFGAFVILDEYTNKRGLIHISEVASGWIKYIRDHVREGQKIVCKVLNVDPSRHHIDLSLKDVNEHQRREKIQAWKADQKAWKWLQMAYEGEEDHLADVASTLIEGYESLYVAMEDAAVSGIDALAEAGLSPEDASKVLSISQENVKIPYVDITGYVDLISPAPDGIEQIKKALKKAARTKEDEVTLDVRYVGAPRYRIHVTAPDYKLAEGELRKAAQAAIKSIEKEGGEGTFHRQA